jgi:hypothetical protein
MAIHMKRAIGGKINQGVNEIAMPLGNFKGRVAQISNIFREHRLRSQMMINEIINRNAPGDIGESHQYHAK